jgi:hypothetical protein
MKSLHFITMLTSVHVNRTWPRLARICQDDGGERFNNSGFLFARFSRSIVGAEEVNHCMHCIFGLSAKLRFPKLMIEKKIIFC